MKRTITDDRYGWRELSDRWQEVGKDREDAKQEKMKIDEGPRESAEGRDGRGLRVGPLGACAD